MHMGWELSQERIVMLFTQDFYFMLHAYTLWYTRSHYKNWEWQSVRFALALAATSLSCHRCGNLASNSRQIRDCRGTSVVEECAANEVCVTFKRLYKRGSGEGETNTHQRCWWSLALAPALIGSPWNLQVVSFGGVWSEMSHQETTSRFTNYGGVTDATLRCRTGWWQCIVTVPSALPMCLFKGNSDVRVPSTRVLVMFMSQ